MLTRCNAPNSDVTRRTSKCSQAFSETVTHPYPEHAQYRGSKLQTKETIKDHFPQ